MIMWPKAKAKKSEPIYVKVQVIEPIVETKLLENAEKDTKVVEYHYGYEKYRQMQEEVECGKIRLERSKKLVSL